MSNSTSASETGIYIWHYADSSSQPEKLKLLDFGDHLHDFHPLGIEYQPASKTIVVLNLASAGSRVEMFKLVVAETAATFVRTLAHPALSAPNSVAAISEAEYFITNDHYFSARSSAILSALETYLGIPGGSIVYVKYDPSAMNKPPIVQTLARLNFANGVALLNASTVAVASSSLASVTLYTIDKTNDGPGPRLSKSRTIQVPFHADNLSVDSNGKLLIAGHPHAPSMEEVAKNAARCDKPDDAPKEHCDHKAPSGIAEWSEQEGLKMLYTGFDFQSSTTALRDVSRRIGMVVGLYANGVMTWRV